MPRILLTLLALAVLVYLGLCVALFIRQRSMIYLPQPRAAGSEVASITLASGDADIVVSLRPHRGPNALLYFGGNAEDVSTVVPELAAAFPDHAVYAPHYRGYGGSSGAPTEADLFADALVLFDRIYADHPNVAIVGRSLGSGIATYVATQRPLTRLVLVTPYDSVQEVAAQQFRYIPVRWLIRDKFESWRYAQQISVATLIVMAEHDEVIPRPNTEALYAHFRPGIATLKVVPASDHVNIVTAPEYMALLQGKH